MGGAELRGCMRADPVDLHRSTIFIRRSAFAACSLICLIFL